MDLPVVLPRVHQLLIDEGYLAIVGHDAAPDPWSILGELVQRYRIDGGYQPYDLITDLVQRRLFQKVGERQTAPTPFVQSIDESIESYQSRSGFSRERMGPARATAFDEEARAVLRDLYPEGSISFQVVGSVVWGIPRG